jgi:hypothetical protein
MKKLKAQREQKEYSPEELELALMLDSYSTEITLKSLAKRIHATEEQVKEYLANLGLLQVVSKERVAERKRIKVLARQFFVDLARATQESYDNRIAH